MNDFKIQLYKNQEQFLAKLLPKQYSFQLYKVRKNINDYQYMQFDKKLKKQQSIILSRKQSRSISLKQQPDIHNSSEQKIQINQLYKNQILTELQQKCLALLKRLKKHQSSYPFRCPVDSKFLQIPEYQQIVLQPIDLKTMQQNVKKNGYSHIGQLQRDIYKMIMNSYKFNQKQTSVFQRTIVFENYFVQVLKQRRSQQIKIQPEQIPEIIDQTIIKFENNPELKIQNSQNEKNQHQQDQYSNPNFNKLMSEYQSKVEQQFSEPQISSSNKISSSQVQKSLNILIRKLNMYPLSRIKKMTPTTKFNFLQTNMPLGQKKRLFQKIFKLKQQDYMHVVEILTRNKKNLLIQNQFQIDFQKIDSKLLRQIQNFVILRSQSMNQQYFYDKNRKIQKKKKIKKKKSKKVLQDQNYFGSQGTKIKIKYQQDDEYLPQHEISEQMINQSEQYQQKMLKKGEYEKNHQSNEHHPSAQIIPPQIFEQQITPVNNNRQNSRDFHSFHETHNDDSNIFLNQSNNRIRQNLDSLDNLDQIDLYFNTSHEQQIRKLMWDQ